MFPGLDLCDTYPANTQNNGRLGSIDDSDRDLSDVLKVSSLAQTRHFLLAGPCCTVSRGVNL